VETNPDVGLTADTVKSFNVVLPVGLLFNCPRGFYLANRFRMEPSPVPLQPSNRICSLPLKEASTGSALSRLWSSIPTSSRKSM
jgi:hypothetical protein